MRTVNTIAELRAVIKEWKRQGLSVGFAPTMGNLHAGHIALVSAAKQQCDKAVSSVFVNPLQFGPHEDLEAYPRTLAEDQQKLTAAGCDLLFAPPVEEMYPQGRAAVTHVSVPELTRFHCGKSRPGHFDGVTTVVSKLFNLVTPDKAFFGKKDYQQWRVIEQMAVDLCFDVEIIGIDTCREASGLALSSRNQYLSDAQRQVAPSLRQVLLSAKSQLEDGQSAQAVATTSKQALKAAGFKPDYFNICDQKTLTPQKGVYCADGPWVILAAAYLGRARLLDNIEIFAINS